MNLILHRETESGVAMETEARGSTKLLNHNSKLMSKSTTKTTAEETPQTVMGNVKRGADPIPGIVPLVGLGLPSGKATYDPFDLDELKKMGMNVMSTLFKVSVSSRMEGFTVIVNTDVNNVTKAITNGTTSGVRIIPGINYSASAGPSQSMYSKRAWSKIIKEDKNQKCIPAWRIWGPTKPTSNSTAASEGASILSEDNWNRPILFPLVAADASISDMGGSSNNGWTEENKFDLYCMKLHEECPPSIWWSTQRAFANPLAGEEINPLFISSLKRVKNFADKKTRAVWSTVHCSFASPEGNPSSEADISTTLLDKMKTEINLEAHLALAMGARGLVFQDLCGGEDNIYYPYRKLSTWISTEGKESTKNKLGTTVQNLCNDIKKVEEAFLNTSLRNIAIVNATTALNGIFDSFSAPFGPLTKIENQKAPLLVSHFVNPFGSKEYIVVVNLSSTLTQTIKTTFSDTMNNLNPRFISYTPPSIGTLAIPVIPPIGNNESSTGTTFNSKLEPGEWRVFSRQRPLSDFGIKD